MAENLDIGDLTLKQLLQTYQNPDTFKNDQLRPAGQQSLSSQNNVKKFSEVMNDQSNNVLIDQKVDQSLAHIVDNLIKKIGS